MVERDRKIWFSCLSPKKNQSSESYFKLLMKPNDWFQQEITEN